MGWGGIVKGWGEVRGRICRCVLRSQGVMIVVNGHKLYMVLSYCHTPNYQFEEEGLKDTFIMPHFISPIHKRKFYTFSTLALI